jgi:hypothetical protein
MRWEKSLPAGALALLLSASSLGAVRAGAWVKTEKTLTQLLSEKFDSKSIFLVSPVPATIYILQKTVRSMSAAFPVTGAARNVGASRRSNRAVPWHQWQVWRGIRTSTAVRGFPEESEK